MIDKQLLLEKLEQLRKEIRSTDDLIINSTLDQVIEQINTLPDLKYWVPDQKQYEQYLNK